MYIKFKNNTIKNKTNSVENYHLDDIEQELKKIEQIVIKMGESWKGTDYDTFQNAMKITVSDLKKLKKSIDSYNNYIKGYSTTLEKLDFQYKQKLIKIK